MTEQEIIEEFKKRRNNYLKAVKPWIVIFIVGASLLLIADKYQDAIQSYFLLISIIGIIMFVAPIIMFTKKTLEIYRCPKCNDVPMTRTGFMGSGGIGLRNWVTFNPLHCANCGAKLK